MSAFDQFRALTPRQQFALVGALLVVSCLLFTTVWFFVLRTTYRPVFQNLRPADAATIVADLDRKKVAYQLADGGRTILVPSEAVDSTRLNVITDDLPLKGTVGFELFNKSDMGLTDFAQKINYQRALQGELERTIMSLDGIESARVHLSLGEDRVFRDDRVPPKASVTVRMHHPELLSGASAQGIRRLVAAAVPGLEAAEVVIVDEHGGLVGAPAAVIQDLVSPALEQQQGIEQYYAGRIAQGLRQVSPKVDIPVHVAAVVPPGGSTSLTDWTPNARNFALHVTLDAAPDPAIEQGIQNAVQGAIGTVADHPDVIEFSPPESVVLPNSTRPQSRRTVALVRAAPAPQTEDDGWQPTLATIALFLFLLGVAIAAVRRVRRPNRLSQQQLDTFTARLRGALGEGLCNADS